MVKLYVGNLPVDVKEKDLFTLFNKNPHLDVSVSIVKSQITGQRRGFAYVSLVSKSKDLAEEQLALEIFEKNYHGTKWRGTKIVVEKAKPCYLERLKLEWLQNEQDKEKRQQQKVQLLAAVNPEATTQSRYRGRKIVFTEAMLINLAKHYNSIDGEACVNDSETDSSNSSNCDSDATDGANDEDDEEDNNDHEEHSEKDTSEEMDGCMKESTQANSKVNVPDISSESESNYSGSEVEKSALAYLENEGYKVTDTTTTSDCDDSVEETVNVEKSALAYLENEGYKVVGSTNNDEYLGDAPSLEKKSELSMVDARREANIRRMEAMKLKEIAVKKNEAKYSVDINLGNVMNKKVVFNSDSDCSISENEVAIPNKIETASSESSRSKKVISNWMGDSSESEDEDNDNLDNTYCKEVSSSTVDDEEGDVFRIRPEFQGIHGKKLFEMQKKFGGDNRFKIDSRFIDDEFGGNDIEDDSDEEGTGFIDDENREQIEQMKPYVEVVDSNGNLTEDFDRYLDIVQDFYPNMKLDKFRKKNLVLENDTLSQSALTKNAGWNACVQRYDPLADNAKDLEDHSHVSSSDDDENNPSVVTKDEKPLEVVKEDSGERYFAASNELSNMFTRVRKNSEDGEEGEAAFDGLTGMPNASSSGFSFGSLFNDKLSPNEIEKKDGIGQSPEKLISSERNIDSSFHFMESFSKKNEDEAVDNVKPSENITTLGKDILILGLDKKINELIEFGSTFVRPQLSEKELGEIWASRRKKFTMEFKRKKKQAVKSKRSRKTNDAKKKKMKLN